MRECCDCPDCHDCFAEDADSPCCRLSKNDILMLKIERPAWAMPIVEQLVYKEGCPCPTNTRLTGNQNYAAAADILVQYRHFNAPHDVDGYMWFTENGSFGVRGSQASGGFDLWYLWPPLCPQKTGNAPACCNISCNCSASTPTYLGPLDTYLNSQAGDVCAQSNENLSTFQKQIIDGGPTPGRLYTGFFTCTDGSSVNARTVCEYEGYDWLQGIYDDTNDYKHYYWDGSGVSQASGFFPLARTIVAVYHKEKWYKACEKYGPGSSSCSEVQTWDCRVPEYWIYGCAGVPIFSWEIREMLDAGKITQDEYEWFFEAEYTNAPLSSGAYGKSLVSKLESSHWHAASDAAGFGILETRDYRGLTLPGETTPVPSTEVRIVRKDLARWSGSTKTVVPNRFFAGRPGGWTHTCSAPPRNGTTGGGNCAGLNIMNGNDVAAAAPQVPREVACKAAGGECDNSIYDFPQDQRAATGRCFSASPFPQCGTCSSTNSCNGCTVCDPCEDDCDLGLLSVCGQEQPYVCSQDSWEADCESIHFTFTAYYHDQTGNPDFEKCVRVNHAYLWMLNKNCEVGTDGCVTDTCPPGPTENTPKRGKHYIGPSSTRLLTCGERNNSAMCDGAQRLLVDPSGGWVCPGSLAKRLPAVDPDTDPGTAQKGPYGPDGCGRYLCQDRNFPLGGCCLADGTCIDAVTEAQCSSCGGTWHGKDSCCGTDDVLCEE